MEEKEITIDTKQKFMIFSIVAFLITLLSASYSWLQNDMVNTESNITLTSASIVLSFRGTSELILADLAPSETVTKTFSVQNTSSLSTTYTLKWRDVETNLADRNYFMYRLIMNGEEIILPNYLPSRDTNIITDLEIGPNETQSFELIIEYVNDPMHNQLNNADLTFSGNLGLSQAIETSTIANVSNIYIDNVLQSETPDTYVGYILDETRTYCTNGTSVVYAENSLNLINSTPSTTCEIYLATSQVAELTNDPYNLLIIDLDGGTLKSNPETRYRHQNDLVELGIPEKTGYSFMGWDVSGGNTTLQDNTKIVMGSTYSYAKATWAVGHWRKTTATCTNNGPETYNQTYKTCNTTSTSVERTKHTCAIQNYTYQRCDGSVGWGSTLHTKTVGGSSQCLNQTCSSVSDIGNKKKSACITNFIGTCSKQICGACGGGTPAKCSGWSVAGKECVDGSIQMCCVPKVNCTSFSCPTGYSGSCSANYTYKYYECEGTFGWSTNITDAHNPTNIATTCDQSNYQKEKLISTNYGWNSTLTYDTQTANGDVPVSQLCVVNSTACSSSTTGNTYVSSCGTPTHTYAFSSTTTRSVDENGEAIHYCNVSDNFECNGTNANQVLTTACTPLTYGMSWSSNTVNANSCFAETQNRCSYNNDTGNTYVSSCVFVAE